jgi:hypothetical protein
VKAKIFYQKDYLTLLVKYGLEEPQQLAGIAGAAAARAAARSLAG